MRTISPAARRAVPAILLVPLVSACGPMNTLGEATTSSSPVSDSPTTTDSTGPVVGAPSPVAPSTATTAATELHVVHSPGVVTDDAHLAPGQCHARTSANGQPLPDPACTPGAIDPAVTQADIASTICQSGYTSTIRPPASDTGRWKIRTYVYYGLNTATSGEYDHLVPLELGGTNTTSNLWIEPGRIPNPKDTVENRLHDEVCAGQITLAAAQRAIAADWTTAPWLVVPRTPTALVGDDVSVRPAAPPVAAGRAPSDWSTGHGSLTTRRTVGRVRLEHLFGGLHLGRDPGTPAREPARL